VKQPNTGLILLIHTIEGSSGFARRLDPGRSGINPADLCRELFQRNT
jgi:hypothetical protein